MIEINQSISLKRRKNDVISSNTDQSQDSEGGVELGKITYEYSNYELKLGKFKIWNPLGEYMNVNNQTLTDLQEKIWYVIKTTNSNINVNSFNGYTSNFKYELRKKDIIKLGRIKFLIKDINIAEGSYQTTQETFKPFQECEYDSFNYI
jgi:hypothetical protein